MNGELALIASRLLQAKTPEEIFGELSGAPDDQAARLKQIYHQLARITHPDVYRKAEDQSLAQVAFGILTELFQRAEAQVQAGAYGGAGVASVGSGISLYTSSRAYVLAGGFTTSGPYNLYPCHYEEGGRSHPALLKIVREPHCNDLAQNEARILGILRAGRAAEKLAAYLPELIDTFIYQEDGVERQVNVFRPAPESWYSLEQVRQAYPHGIDPRDLAWIWRRLLVALGFVHRNGVIHGAVLPANVHIQPEQHGLILENWSYAVVEPWSTGEVIPALDPACALDDADTGWYPAEVLNWETPLPATDIDLSARCMIYLLGGDPRSGGNPRKGVLPDTIPPALRSFLKSCILPSIKSRPQDAWVLKEEFDDLLRRLWGERRFHPFTMNPATVN